jgi:hypothetical protein
MLGLERNRIRKMPAAVVAAALGRNRALTAVDLSWNGFDDPPAVGEIETLYL